MVMFAFNPNTQEAVRQEARLIYTASSNSTGATWRPYLKKKKRGEEKTLKLFQ